MIAFDKRARQAGHERRYSIRSTMRGWEVREERDSRLVKRVEYHDWHRVEHARRSLDTTLAGLRDEGWQVDS
jgi:hypothetical protein